MLHHIHQLAVSPRQQQRQACNEDSAKRQKWQKWSPIALGDPQNLKVFPRNRAVGSSGSARRGGCPQAHRVCPLVCHFRRTLPGQAPGPSENCQLLNCGLIKESGKLASDYTDYTEVGKTAKGVPPGLLLRETSSLRESPPRSAAALSPRSWREAGGTPPASAGSPSPPSLGTWSLSARTS